MAFIVDHQATNAATLKHFCRICKKGFGCGRALGGHMRAHGIGDDVHVDHDDDDNDNNSDWDDTNTKLSGTSGGSNPPSNKRMYALRTNPNNRLRSCRACENCGKEFGSWKSFLEHGKCITDDAESLVSSSPADSGGGGGGNWSKRKRSFRAKVGNMIVNSSSHTHQNNMQICASREEEDLANCLMMLSNAAVDPAAAEPEDSCASASRDELEQRRNTHQHLSLNPIFNISPLSFRVAETNPNLSGKAKSVINNNNKGLFECKACKKVFNSHQALGGHRASHKKVKGCFAARNDVIINDSPFDDDTSAPPTPIQPDHKDHQFLSTLTASDKNHGGAATSNAAGKRKSKVHECTICHRIFSSGQALGGHKRCHWITSNSAAPADPTALAKFQQFQESIEQINVLASVAQQATAAAAIDLKLDLNFPANNNNNNNNVASEIYFQTWNLQRRNHVVGEENEVVTENNNGGDGDIDLVHVTVSDGRKKKKKESGLVGDEDEADSKVKLAKLSELKDMNGSEGSSPWLQVGIGSTTDVGAVVP